MSASSFARWTVKTQFRPEPIRNAAERAERRNLFKCAAWIRTNMRRSIRNRKKPAAANEPPHSHTGALKNYILFAYDPNAHSAVIGAILKSTKQKNAGPQPPEILENGGTVTITRKVRGQKIRFRAHFTPHPFAEPAKERAAQEGTLAEYWKDTIK